MGKASRPWVFVLSAINVPRDTGTISWAILPVVVTPRVILRQARVGQMSPLK